MPDREKVIKGCELLKDFLGDGLPGKNVVFNSYINIVNDAIALLKDQEAVEPTINEYGEAYCICGENVGIIPSSKNLPSIRSKYCSECGRRMKWKYD